MKRKGKMNINCDTGMALDLVMGERRTERLEGDEWKPIPFFEIKKGNIFRLFDDGEDPVEVGELYEAKSDAYIGEDQFYRVVIYDVIG